MKKILFLSYLLFSLPLSAGINIDDSRECFSFNLEYFGHAVIKPSTTLSYHEANSGEGTHIHASFVSIDYLQGKKKENNYW